MHSELKQGVVKPEVMMIHDLKGQKQQADSQIIRLEHLLEENE